MPEKLDDEQLKAWARAAKLAFGENRIEALREQSRPVWVQLGAPSTLPDGARP
jgi:hypothetical protein